MRKWLVRVTLLFGLVCCVIALAHIVFGHGSVPGSAPGFSATDDSEDRFYATLFLGFGAAMIWCSRDLDNRAKAYGALLLVFFAGGIARLISVAQMGLPEPLFQFLGLVELIMPPVLWWWETASRAAKNS